MADNTRTTNPGWLNPIQGNKNGDHDQSLKTQASRISTVYASKESATGIVSNVDLTSIAAFSALFTVVKIGYRCIIRTNQDITIRFNASTNDAITVEANTAFDCDFLEFTSIYITAAASANLKVFIA